MEDKHLISEEYLQKSLKHIRQHFFVGLVSIDLETTGLSPLVDHIIEIAAIKVVNDKTVTFKTLIKPPVSIPEETIQFHGITDEDVKDAPTIKEILPKLLEFIGGLPIIAHNAKFDCGFLTFAFHKNNIKVEPSDVFCTVKAARKAIKGVENYKLSTLSKQLEIPLQNHHRAFDDALACLLLFNIVLKRTAYDERFKKEVLKEARLFNMVDFQANTTMELPEHLEILEDYTKKQKVVFIKYKGGSLKGKLRPIKPVSLLPMPEGNVVYAHCLISDLYKTFAIKKIITIEKANPEDIKQIYADLEIKREKR